MVELEGTVATTFPRFQDLPAELRLLIWRFALPRRVFEIRRETVSIKEDGEPDVTKDLDHDAWRIRSSDLVAVLLAPPALLSVCREARKYASRSGSWKCVGSRPRGAGRAIRLGTWFDPSTDTLCFDDSDVQHVPGQVTEANGIVTEHINNPAVTRIYFASSPASPICVSLAALAGHSGKFFVVQWKRKRGFWSGVPRYQFYHDSILMHLGRSPKVQEVFGKGVDRCYTVLVDAHDHAKLRQLRQLYVEESDPSYFQVSNQNFSFLLNCGAAVSWNMAIKELLLSNDARIPSISTRRVADWLEDITEPDEGYSEQSHNDLKNLWLKAQDDVPSSAFILSANHANIQMRSLIEPGAVLHTIQQFDHTHSWCQDIIKAMPAMQLVVHFRLCITNHDEELDKVTRSLEN
ncbi:hypothetical protein F4677DRAFT_445774 [Hypoxylon crocopeplum]|nr:hypothetical protein F4677DRAFT_445774 [Hypoxylon crocopeplum]